MANQNNLIKTKIRRRILYNSTIFLIFLFWFCYSMFDNIILLYLICFVLVFFIIFSLIIDSKQGLNTQNIIIYISLLLIPIVFLIVISFSYIPFSPPFFFSFTNLIGIRHKIDILSFLILFSLILLKLIGIKVYMGKSAEILEVGKGDPIFQFFTVDVNYEKIVLFILLFPLSAFVEELIYRSLLLSFFVYYYNLNVLIGIAIISIIFGLVHFSTSKNWGHVISTLISSVIYSFALIQLGILYAWILHLITNLFVILFYFQARKYRTSS